MTTPSHPGRAAPLALVLTLAATPLLAQDLIGNDLILSEEIFQNGLGLNDFSSALSLFDGRMCIGNGCDDATVGSPGTGPLKLRWSQTDILFEDSSTTVGTQTNDWRIEINDGIGVGRFTIQDEETGNQIFNVEAGGPTNAMWIGDAGDVGLGTSLPQADLHIFADSVPTIRMDQGSGGGKPPYVWETQANNVAYSIRDVTANRSPVRVESGTPDNSLYLDSSGFVGFGTNAPEELLHIRSNAANADAFALFDANGSGSDAAFLLRQNGTVPTTWEFRNQEGSGRLNVGLAGGNTPLKIDDAANNNLLRLGLNGQTDVVSVTGRLLVNNTQLSVPDYVFEDDYELMPLAEVSAHIKTHGHLPGIPSAAEVAQTGLDMFAMQMALLEKIEEMMLHDIAQERTIENQAALIGDLAARLAALEATR